MKVVLTFFMILTIAAAAGADSPPPAGEKDHLCFRTVDADRDNTVTFQEFAKYFGEDPETFKVADRDKDGKLTHDEYHRFVRGRG